MSTISVTLPTDGTTADVGDYNNPITTIVNEFNGNIDNNNIKSGAAIDPNKITFGKTVDANGWTIYNYGSFKTYKKRGSTALTAAANTWSTTAALTSWPVGFSTLGTNFLEGTASTDDAAIRCQFRPQGTDGGLTVAYDNSFNGTINTTLYWSVSFTTP